MKIRLTLFAALFTFLTLWAGPALAVERTGVVVDTMTKGIYTYIEVKTASGQYWAAVPKMKVKKGDKVDVAPGSEMRDFYSPSLDKTFSTIIFASSAKVISKESPSSKKPATKKGPAAINFKTVAQLYNDSKHLKGKMVNVRGKVVKFNSGIMGKNFLHLQDGTGGDGTNDLTVTTQETVRVGDKVIVTGKLNTNKDFGAGYSYSLILEEATIQPE